MGCFVIAEAGVNHNGSPEMALRLIDAAVAAGADAVKFQTFTTENLVRPGVRKAEYQMKATGDGDQYSMIKALELNESAHRLLNAHCRSRDIEFMSTPFDESAMHLLNELGMRRIKVASGELTNRSFLEHLANYSLPMIVSTGMADLNEVEEALRWLNGAGAGPITLLHCTSNYPAAAEDVNLKAMQTMADRFGLPVGYSDHTQGIEVAIAAVALGATVIEKHFTLDRTLPGPDHAASLEPDELKAMVQSIRNVERAFGDGRKVPRKSELPVRDIVRRSIMAARDLPAGHLLNRDDLVFLRPGTGISAKACNEVIGRRILRPIEAGAMLAWSDFA